MIFNTLSMTDENWQILKQKMTESAPVFARRVAPIYKALDWNWFYLESYPTEEQIQEHIVELIEKLSYGNVLCISSGGIKVSIDEEEGFSIGRLAMEIEMEMGLGL
jgi:hypothetical protein